MENLKIKLGRNLVIIITILLGLFLLSEVIFKISVDGAMEVIAPLFGMGLTVVLIIISFTEMIIHENKTRRFYISNLSKTSRSEKRGNENKIQRYSSLILTMGISTLILSWGFEVLTLLLILKLVVIIILTRVRIKREYK